MRKLISSFVFSIFLLSGNGWGATYYVDQTGGDDAKNGLSPVFAWKTIAKVNATSFMPGDSILFKRGEVWRESLVVTSSGTAGNPITYGAYGTGNKPIIQPTTEVSSWTQVGATNVYYATLASAPYQVFINAAYCQPAHWPTAVGAITPTFQYPSSNSGNATTLIDTDFGFKTSAEMVGAILSIYTGSFTQRYATVSAWNDSTKTITFGSISANPDTGMRYYLTAGSGQTNALWMMTENTWWWDDATDRLYVWKTGGGSPSGSTVEWSGDSTNAITAQDKRYITVDGLLVRFAGRFGIFFTNWVSDIAGINIINSESHYSGDTGIMVFPIATANGYEINDSFIDNNVVDHGGSYGIRMSWAVNSCGDITNNTITNTSGIYPQLPKTGSAIHNYNQCSINGNTINNAGYNGIFNSANGNTISHNIVSNTNKYLGDGGGYYSAGSNVVISYNTFTNTGYGIYIDEIGPTNNVIRNNTVTGGTFGVFLHRVDNTDIYNNRLTGPFTGYAAIGTSNSDRTTPVDIYYNIIDCGDKSSEGIRLNQAVNSLGSVNNNVITNCSNGIMVWTESSNTLASVKNNIFYNNTTHARLKTGFIQSMNNNLYYGAGTWNWNNEVKTTFALWKSASSYDAAGVNSDPLFVSASDFRLQSSSPAINAGANIGLTTDYSGNPIVGVPDIGAYEYTSLYTSLPTAPANLSATPASQSQITLSWTDQSTDETGFRIERKTGAGGTYAQIGTASANAKTYDNGGLAEGTTYFYRVSAVNGAGNSAYSNEASATTPVSLSPKIPLPPSDIRISP
jgi:parallel beta-helix repeat protein